MPASSSDRPALVLATASARRRKILKELGVPFEITVPVVEEAFNLHAPVWTARENAERKSRWAAQHFPDRHHITADTIVAFNGHCVTKPVDLAEARRFLRMFSGRPQTVYTGVGLGRPGEAPQVDIVESTVLFRELDESAINTYFDAVDPLDKAGAYDIDQRTDLIIESWSGSYTNIMGLPAELVQSWLRGEGLL